MKQTKRNLTTIAASLAMAGALVLMPFLQAPQVLANESHSPQGEQCLEIETVSGLSDYTQLTESEKGTLQKVYDQADELSAKLTKLLDDEGNVTDEKQAAAIEKELDMLFKTIEPLEDKMAAEDKERVTAENEAWVNELTALSDTEKQDYKVALTTIEKLETDLESIYGEEETPSDEAKAKELETQLTAAHRTVGNIETKLQIAAIHQNKVLSQNEKDTLTNAYQKMNELDLKLDACPNEEEGRQLEAELKKVATSIQTIEEKYYQAKEEN